MPMRLGRLQRQGRRAFGASAGPEVSTSELAGGVGRNRRQWKSAHPHAGSDHHTESAAATERGRLPTDGRTS